MADLPEPLASKYPELGSLLADRRVRACIDNEIVTRDFVIDPSQKVDLLAPVSGG